MVPPMPKGDIRLRTPEGHLNQVADRMRIRRRSLKITQEQLCGRLATATEGSWVPARMDMVRIENGGRIVSDLEIFALAKALECSPTWLLTGETIPVAIVPIPSSDIP
jgi:transcriptional regulator with XRE-family HTH domain